jgi:hypothetical protein
MITDELPADEKLGEIFEQMDELNDPTPRNWFFEKYDVEDPRWRYSMFLLSAINQQKVQPVFKMVDTCAGEFESNTPYYYGTFEVEDDALSRA